jgi:hypothetical protein
MEIVTDLIRSVFKEYSKEGKTNCNAHFAIRMGNLMRQPDQYQLVSNWTSSLTKSTFEATFSDFTDLSDVIDLMTELPMVIGLTCLVFDPKQHWDFQKFRKTVHDMCIWQLCFKLGTDTLDPKVHKVIEIHREVVPSAIALCVFVNDYDKKSHMKPLVSYLMQVLNPVLSDANGELDMERYLQIMHCNMQDQLTSASREIAKHMLEMERLMGDLAAMEDATLVQHSIRRVTEMLQTNSKDHLKAQLIFVDHTELEETTLIQQLTDLMHFAMLCITAPSDSSLKILKATLDRLSNEEAIAFTHALNQLTNTESISDSILHSLFHALERKLEPNDLLDSSAVSLLNMTVHSDASGRWRDLLGNLLQKDEEQIMNKYGKDAHVIDQTHTMQTGLHRLVFMSDLYKLFCQTTTQTTTQNIAIIITFYSEEGFPLFFARTSSLDELPSTIHQWYDELRFYNRMSNYPKEPEPAEQMNENGFIIDESTMTPYEITLRTYVNDLIKQHIDTSSISKLSTFSTPSSDPIRLVQHDHQTALLDSKPLPLDMLSIQYLQEIQRLKRVTKFKEWKLPYKISTACSMNAIVWQDPVLPLISPVKLSPDVISLL